MFSPFGQFTSRASASAGALFFESGTNMMMGDHGCPKCGNNTFQVRSEALRRTVTFICIACWRESQLEDIAPKIIERSMKRRKA